MRVSVSISISYKEFQSLSLILDLVQAIWPGQGTISQFPYLVEISKKSRFLEVLRLSVSISISYKGFQSLSLSLDLV